MRILLDTNVLAASIVGTNLGWQTPPAQIWRRWQEKQFSLLISAQVVTELGRTLNLPWFIARINSENRDLVIRQLLTQAEMVEISTPVTRIAGHPQDDLVLSAAVSGNADYLVTGDAEFLRVEEFQGVKLRTPANFLRELDALTE